MRHVPSAIDEKNDRRCPLNLLRVWHTEIEGWILTEADIEQPQAEAAKLKTVAAAR